MRPVTLGDKHFQIRPLKRKEIMDLAGRFEIGTMFFNISPKDFDAFVDEVTRMLFDNDDRKKVLELTTSETMELARHIIAETWGSADEEKNSSTSGPTAQTPRKQNTAAIVDDPNKPWV